MAATLPKPTRGVSFLLASLVRARRLWFREMLRPHGVTPQQYAILVRLQEQDGLSIIELSERLFADATTLSRTVSRMESHGLVTRVRCEDDRRTCRVALTDASRALVEEMHPALQEAERSMLRGVAPEEVAALERTLRAMLHNVAPDHDLALDGDDQETR